MNFLCNLAADKNKKHFNYELIIFVCPVQNNKNYVFAFDFLSGNYHKSLKL